ncbi:MAG: putative lipid II flippase FtsW [bacterium]|nr:putative lipid II flippase FtsW [bacterium]
MIKKKSEFFADFHDPAFRVELILFCSVLFILFFSAIMIFSASNITASYRFGDPFFFLKRQLIWSFLGLMMLFTGYFLSYKKWQNFSLLFMLISLLLLILVLIPSIGHSVGGARRWLRFGGVGIQPSELAKVAFIFYTADWLDRKHQVMNKNFFVFLPKIFLLMLTVCLIYLEPDLGTTVIIIAIVFSMYFIAGVSKKYIFIFWGLVLSFFAYALLSTPYRLKRVLSFLNPWQHFSDVGYQVVQSYLAIANASFLGTGIGGSKLKLLYLPESHTDFILSIIIEELGVLGSLIVFGFFLIFTYLGIKIALQTDNYFARLVAFGITFLISFQAIMNIAVVTGAIPTKGIPLPFFSFGGSSFVVSMFCIGVLLNIARESRHNIAAKISNY